MSRQPAKSFFNRNNPARAKPHAWSKRQPEQVPSSRKANGSTKPSLPVSAETKSKLDSFAFKQTTEKSGTTSGQQISEFVDQTEHLSTPDLPAEPANPRAPPASAPAPVPAPAVTPKRLAARSKSDGNLLSHTAQDKRSDAPLFGQPAKEPPATPVPRISLAQLIGEDDGTPVAGIEAIISPNERITWGAGTPRPTQATPFQRSNVGSSPLTNAVAKRRYRSSSPDMRLPTWKTPVADPATQLWSRYTSTNQEPINEHSADPSVRLFHNVSDRSPSLRRTNSSDPPNNRVKRRKTTGLEQYQSAEAIMTDVENVVSTVGSRFSTNRKARVNLLADKVKRKMKTPSSPLSKHGMEEYTPPQDDSNEALSEATATLQDETTALADEDSSDGEYGDLDFDMDVYENLEAMATQEAATSTAANNVVQNPTPQEDALPAAAAADDDEFGDFEDDEFEDIETLVSRYDEPASSAHIEHSQRYASGFITEYEGIELRPEDFSDDIAGERHIKRFKVAGVSDGAYEFNGKARRVQKILTVQDKSNKTWRILLRDSWFRETTVTKGDYVNVIGCFDRYSTCIVEDSQNLLIVHPDILVSSTTVADTVKCMRLAVLRERIKAYGDISHAMVYGNLLHALFQMALEANQFSTDFLHTAIQSVIAQDIESLYILKEDVDTAALHLQSKVPLIQAWANLFVSAMPKANAKVTDHNSSSTPIVSIKKLLDIEEHVWSPVYGLKGNIDATVEAAVIENRKAKTLTIPLELKTGKSSKIMEHRAQTMLYTLLMADRYDVDIQCGLLYYMESGEMIRVSAIRNELRAMIQNRNQAACYLRARESLPEVLGQARTCGRCYAKESCFLYHKLLEDGTAKSSGVEQDFLDMTDHLGEKHKKFFRHWDGLLTKEEKDSVRFRRELWTMLSPEREAVGRCFGGLVIVPGSQHVDKDSGKINKYTYTLAKNTSPPGFTFIESQISVSEPIVISDEKGHYALAIGFVSTITNNQITVQVDRRLHNVRTRQRGFNEATNQVFNGLVEVRNTSAQKQEYTYENDRVVYRLDKDEFSSGMARVRNNLLELLSAKDEDKYRRLVVDLEAPKFNPSPSAYQLEYSASQTNLNDDQRQAIQTVMGAQDYALVLGMPGTGKTTTIAHIIRALVSQGKSVLLTSYTHTAVDNILLKIRNDGIEILRLGTSNKVHPEVKGFAALAEAPKKSFSEFHKAIHEPQVVATTCLSINHPVFRERKFDYCIVDEASQITLPVCIGPIKFAKTFILVGDHHQLPPLVKNAEAREGGLDVSLFKLLSDAHPQAVVNLAHQYRMCEEIMTLSNELIYNGLLKCGNEKVAKSSLHIPRPDGLDKFHTGIQQCGKRCWMKNLLSESVKACFVDTDQVPAREVRKGDRTSNPTEAQLAFQLVEAFLSCGVDANSIGVISVYRSQLKLIQHLLRGRPAVEMHTADKFQGRDKDVIIISLVRSNDQNNVGELLRDWRRINVAFTRARTKLIILGSKTTLASNELLKKFVALMENRPNWEYQLPSGAHFMHGEAFGCIGLLPLEEVDTNVVAAPKRTSPAKVNGKIGLLEKKIIGHRSVLGDIMNHEKD